MSGACSTYGGGDRTGAYSVLVGKPEGKRSLGRRRRRSGIMLRWIFRKWVVSASSGSSWLRIGTGGGNLQKRY